MKFRLVESKQEAEQSLFTTSIEEAKDFLIGCGFAVKDCEDGYGIL